MAGCLRKYKWVICAGLLAIVCTYYISSVFFPQKSEFERWLIDKEYSEAFDSVPSQHFMTHAARERRFDIMLWLKENGENVNATDSRGYSPIHIAAAKADFEMLEWLEKEGTDINTDKSPYSPLFMAARNGHISAMQWLIARGADVNAASPNSGYSPIIGAAIFGGVDELVLLESHGADIFAKTAWNESAVHIAARNDHFEAMKWLKGKGIGVNEGSKYNQYPIHEAARCGNLAVMLWLKEMGAKINVKTNHWLMEQTPMHYLALGLKDAKKDVAEKFAWLAEQGLDINERNKAGETPMHIAAKAGNVEAMKWLKEHGANINAPGYRNQTPLGAAQERRTDMAKESVKWLKANGGR